MILSNPELILSNSTDADKIKCKVLRIFYYFNVAKTPRIWHYNIDVTQQLQVTLSLPIEALRQLRLASHIQQVKSKEFGFRPTKRAMCTFSNMLWKQV
jgi:hypothetical protein